MVGLRALGGVLRALAEGIKGRGTGVIESELKEMENVFALLVSGSLSGLPSPPSFVTLGLLPYIERELRVMVSRSERMDDPFERWIDIVDL